MAVAEARYGRVAELRAAPVELLHLPELDGRRRHLDGVLPDGDEIAGHAGCPQCPLPDLPVVGDKDEVALLAGEGVDVRGEIAVDQLRRFVVRDVRLTREQLRDLWARGVTVGTSAARRFGRHRMPTHAAALAYRGALALFPFLLLIFGLVHAVGLDVITTALARRAVAEQPEDRGAFARWIGAQIEEPPETGILSIGAVTALWAVASGIRGLRIALADTVEGGIDPTTVPLWRRILRSLAIAPVAVVAVVAAALSLLVTSRAIETVAGWLGRDATLAGVFTWLRVPVALVVITLLLAGAYRLAPGARPSFRSVLPGAILASVSWTVMSLGFSAALATVLDYGATYGSFGAAIALLVYLYLSAAVVLAGAEVNAVLRIDRPTTPGRHRSAAGAATRQTISGWRENGH
jgi:membrane protein